MKFKIKNVGKVHNAEVEVDGITVIAGYNNTGKTTILRAVDTVLKTYGNLAENIWKERVKSVRTSLIKTDEDWDVYGIDMPFQVIYRIADDICNIVRDNKRVLIPQERIEAVITMSVADYMKEVGVEQIYLKSDVNADSVLEMISKKLAEVSKREDSAYQKYLAELNIRKIFKGQAGNLLNGNISEIEAFSNFGGCNLKFQNNKLVEEMGIDLGNSSSIYIETRNILDGINPRRNDDISWELRKLLLEERNLNKEEISFEQYQETERNIDIVNEIFNEVLQGELYVNSGTIEYKEEFIDESIKIGNVASGMKLFLILQRLIANGSLRENSWVLIDEPESNLHPDWHLKLAEILVLLKIKMNIRILISSHSPYFMRALEVKMADYGIKEAGRFYLMEEENGMYNTKDVTECTEMIYKQLYKPLELL